MMNAMKLLMLTIVLIVSCFSMAFADEGKDESGKGREYPPAAQYGYDNDRGSYFHEHGYTRLDIPEGHYPPPGECRIWYPDRPAGHQPPPGKCHRLRNEVPPGAWLIRHPKDDPEHVHVIVYDDRRPGTILVTGEFDLASGVFLRVVVD